MKNIQTIANILIVGLLILIFFMFKSVNNKDATINILSNYLKSSRDSTRTFVDKYGITHNILEVQNLNHNASNVLKDSTINSLAERVKVKPKQITKYVPFKVTKDGVIEFTVEQLDSLIAKTQKEKGDTNAIISIPFETSISVNYLEYWNRPRFLFWKNGIFLQNKRNYVDIFSTEDSVKTDIYKAISIGDKYSSFGGSVTVGFTIPNAKPVLVVGLSWQPNFFRFKRKK